MSALEQALTDYLRLRRSLGHELAEAGWLLPGFVAYLDAHGSRTVTIEATLAWVQLTETGRGRRSGRGGSPPCVASPATWPAPTPTPRCRRWG